MDTIFDTMTDTEIEDCVAKLQAADISYMSIVLTNGSSILAEVPAKHTEVEWTGNKSGLLERRHDSESSPSLYIWASDPEEQVIYQFQIPKSQIAGMTSVNFSRDSKRAAPGVHAPFELQSESDPELGKATAENCLRAARAYGWKFFQSTYHLAYKPSQKYAFGDTALAPRTALYGDWAFFGRKEKGLKAIGAGVMGFSLSSSWQKSQWSALFKSLRATNTTLSAACVFESAVVDGFPVFLEGDNATSLEIEGESWLPCLLCERRIPDGEAPKPGERCLLAYLRTDSFMYPKELWERIAHPIRCFGEIQKAAIDAGSLGAMTCYLKVRGAGTPESQD